jgi:hypothetical protein
VWTAIGWVACVGAAAKNVVELSLRGTVHLFILLVVAWPVVQWGVVNGLDYLLHGEFLHTLTYAVGIAVAWPLLKLAITHGSAFISSGLAHADEDASPSDAPDETHTEM